MAIELELVSLRMNDICIIFVYIYIIIERKEEKSLFVPRRNYKPSPFLHELPYLNDKVRLERIFFLFLSSLIICPITQPSMRPRVLIALFLFLILMGILGFAPIHLHEQINDKMLHFSIFFILACFLYFLWNLSVKRNLILATSSLLFLAIGSEFIQGLLPVSFLYLSDAKLLIFLSFLSYIVSKFRWL